jgi:hypothetical protein
VAIEAIPTDADSIIVLNLFSGVFSAYYLLSFFFNFFKKLSISLKAFLYLSRTSLFY